MPPSIETIIARYEARNHEISWRGAQRDAIVVFALVLTGTMLNTGIWALAGPIPLLFLASLWRQHDKRIGSGAAYLRDVIEPALNDIEGYEKYLDRTEPDRSYSRKWSFSATTARFIFPTLQLACMVAGIYHFVTAEKYSGTIAVFTVAAFTAGVWIVGLTWTKVKHKRNPAPRPPAPASTPPTP